MKLAIKSTLDLPKVVFGTYELEHAATQADQGCSIVGSFWVEDPEEAWMDGEVVEVNGEDITVNSASGKMAPVASKGTTLKSSGSFSHHPLVDYSHNIVESLDGLLCTLKKIFNGEYVKAGLAELELWCDHAKEEVPSAQQLYRVCTLYWDDNYNTLKCISRCDFQHEILTDDSNDDDSNSFLLDDNYSS